MTTPPAAPAPSFSLQDANDLLSLASKAPLPGGLEQARVVDALLQRSNAFFKALFAGAAAAKKGGKTRKGRK